MKATIRSTKETVESVHTLDGVVKIKARVWEGVTAAGVPFVAYIPCVQVSIDADNTVFERELREHKPADKATFAFIDARLF